MNCVIKSKKKKKSLNINRRQKERKCSLCDLTHSDVVQDPFKLQRLVLSLHCSRVQTIAAINKLNDVARGAAYCQVVLRAQILQGLHQPPLSRHRQEETGDEMPHGHTEK